MAFLENNISTIPERKVLVQFMTEDMHMRGSDRLRREHLFHGDDDAITVDDLWEAWFESDERAWTNEQVRVCFEQICNECVLIFDAFWEGNLSAIKIHSGNFLITATAAVCTLSVLRYR